MTYRNNLNLIYLSCLTFFVLSCTEQPPSEEIIETSLPFSEISLHNLDGFQQEDASNWKIYGDAYANRKQKSHLEGSDGNGVLINLPEDNNGAPLKSGFEHGDIELELDFMMPKGSNSGIYLQGRYEIQLFDSWGKDSVDYSDCGGIYQRWNEQTDQGFDGTAPLVNACKAPGLWQHIKIVFEAPTFDEAGNKVTNARFKEVILNNALIHENVEVSGPTRSSFFDDESPKGPLMIQGDHGLVALRHIRYKLFEQERIELANLHYQFYQGEFDSFDTLNTLKPTKEGNTDSLTFQAAGDFDIYAIQFDGQINAPKDGVYLFDLRAYGPARLLIDNKLISENFFSQNMSDAAYGKVNLTKGEHQFQLTFLKNERPWRRGLSLAYEGPEIPKTHLEASSSVPLPPTPEPLLVNAEGKAALQRGFIMHKGVKRTHAVTVGTPNKINYALEISNGALLEGWRGDFVDATDMWHERGESQLIRPLGSALEFSAKPMFSILASSSSDWPDSLLTDNSPFTYKGYELTAEGIPSYIYDLNGTEIRDLVLPDSDIHGLAREITIPSSEETIYCLLAEGNKIEHLSDGSYAIDDKNYYLEITESSAKATLREQGNLQQLIVPLAKSNANNTLKYSLIW